MLKSNACFPHNWKLPSVSYLMIIALVGVAVVLTPTQAAARRTGAIIGGIAGIAAAAIIANEIARTQRNTIARTQRSRSSVVKNRNRAPQAAVAQREQATSDPFAGVKASKIRSGRDASAR